MENSSVTMALIGISWMWICDDEEKLIPAFNINKFLAHLEVVVATFSIEDRGVKLLEKKCSKQQANDEKSEES